MKLQLPTVPGLEGAENAREHHGGRVVGVNVGLQYIRVSGLEGAGGACHLVPMAVHHMTIESGSRIKQLPTNLASELLLPVISADVTQKVFLVMG